MLDILEAARRALAFVAGMTDRQFLADLKTQSAVLHQLTVLGEATRRVPAAARTPAAGAIKADPNARRRRMNFIASPVALP